MELALPMVAVLFMPSLLDVVPLYMLEHAASKQKAAVMNVSLIMMNFSTSAALRRPFQQ